MKHLEALKRDIERFAKKRELKVEELSAFGNGTYRVELRETAAQPRPVDGFTAGEKRP